MSDSAVDSGHDTNSTIETSSTNNSGKSVTLGKLPHIKSSNSDSYVLPKVLPSHKFRYSVWHDLREACLTGEQLHAPRVRAGPPEKEEQFGKIIENGMPIHHDMKAKQRQNHMNQYENWQDATVINLCYQELFHEYQWKNLYRILAKCQSALTVNLSHNTIVTLKSISFTRCEYLNVNTNYINSISNFPKVSKVKRITAVDNAITSLDGLGKLNGTALEELHLSGNPISFKINYRQNVFAALPNLKVLDGVPRLPSDSEFSDEKDPQEGSGCTIL